MNKNTLVLLFLLISVFSVTKSANGEIECTYEINDASSYIDLIGERFMPDPSIVMTINGIEVTFTKKYLFSGPGTYIIKYLLTEPLNMDFMFQDIKDFIRVDISSSEKLKLTRFESTLKAVKTYYLLKWKALILVKQLQLNECFMTLVI